MIAAIVLGGVVGLGVLFIVRGLFPPRPRLVDALAELRTLPQARALVILDDAAVGFTARLGGPIARLLRRMGFEGTFDSLRHDLAILERSPERHLAEKVTVGLFGFLFVPVVAGLLSLDDAHLPIMLPIWGAVCFGILGFFVPDLGVHADASGRRGEFRHGLSAYLDLVVITLAAGSGIETALTDAAEVGDGFAFTRLRRALQEARLAQLPPAEAFGRLGTDLGIDELIELSASLDLAGAEGARVRSSLQAKALSMRAHELSEAETSDQAATERMSLPLVLLLAGFMVLIGFPALVRVSHGQPNRRQQRKEVPGMIELQIFWRMLDVLRDRWATLRAEPEAGYTSEFFVVTGIIVAIAIGALAYLAVQIMTAAHNVQVTNNNAS